MEINRLKNYCLIIIIILLLLLLLLLSFSTYVQFSIKIAEFVLRNNYFEINNKVFRYISVTLIDTKFDLSYASIILQRFDNITLPPIQNIWSAQLFFSQTLMRNQNISKN